MLNKHKIRKYSQEQQVGAEIVLSCSLKHENVLECYGAFWDHKNIYLILEYAPHGELFNEMNLQPDRRFKEPQAANIIYQVA